MIFIHFLSFILIVNFQTIEILDELVEESSEKMDVRDKQQVISRMKAAVASKQFGQEDILCPLISDVSLLSNLMFPSKPSNFSLFESLDSWISFVSGLHPSMSKEPCKLQCG